MSSSRRNLLFALYCVAVLLANLDAWRVLVHLSLTSATASYLILIPLVTAVLIVQERAVIFSNPRFDSRPGLALMALGGTLMIVATVAPLSQSVWLTMRILALVVLWNGGFLLFYGREAARRALFGLLFLAFTIPIPDSLIAAAVQVLKVGSTEAVAILFDLTGTVYHRAGFVFSLPGVIIEVADECSGIRSSIGLLLTGLLAGHMFLRNKWAMLVLMLAILPIAILKNATRIVVLTLLSVHVDPEFLTGQLHHEGGIVFFVLAVAMMAPLVMLLRSLEAPRASLSGVRAL